MTEKLMKAQLEIELDDLIIKWVRENAQTNGNGHVEFTGHTNLLESGLLDSIGFVELIVFMEGKTGYNIDYDRGRIIPNRVKKCPIG
jgi:hypothetical protein